jgi:ABC-type branched-subunit amino acid transport system substrate-binding protein
MAVVPFKIGYLHERESPDTGDFLDALELRFEEAFQSGEIDRPVEIVIEHGYGLPGGSAELLQGAWQRLADRGVLAIVGPGNTDSALAVMRQAQAEHLSTINWSGSERSRGEYCFQYQVGSLPDEGPLIAAAVAAAGIGRVAVIRDRSPIGEEYWQYFNEATGHHKLAVTSDQKISPVATGLDSEIAFARQSGAEGLVYLGFGGVLPELWQAMADAGWRPPAFTNTAGLHWYYMSEEVRANGVGWVYVDMYDERNQVQAALLDRLEMRRGVRPYGPIAPAMYDMATLLVGALRLAPVHTREGVKEGLERVHQLPAACGGAGTVMGFGPWERTALKGPDFLIFRTMGVTASDRYDAFPPSYERLATG